VLPHPDPWVHAFGQKQIHPRTETDHADPLSRPYFLPGSNPRDDLPSQEACHLSHEDVSDISPKVNQGPGVHLRGLGLPRHLETPPAGDHLRDPAGARSAVDVDIEEGEKDADFCPSSSVYGGPDPNDPSISRGQNRPALARGEPLWVSKEVAHRSGEQPQEEASPSQAKRPEDKPPSQQGKDKGPPLGGYSERPSLSPNTQAIATSEMPCISRRCPYFKLAYWLSSR